MATIIQRILNTQESKGGDTLMISEDEIEQLMNEVNKLEDNNKK
jgi:hypothetical protein